ncbi:MAG: TerC/Alx family metal homeostasis membrane protein [Bacteroidia bacterium]|nr:TerC/Alx family metal homeostasis membrane protein [Bacteroidia bacterium]
MQLLMLSKPMFMGGFLILVCVGLALDLGLFKKNSPHTIGFKEALWRTIGWVSAGLLFGVVVYFFHHNLHEISNNYDYALYKQKYESGFELRDKMEQTAHAFSKEVSIQYITGYFIEYSLSVDNLFVMMLIFSSFKVAEKYQKNVLLWGVVGAVVMLFCFIFIGSALLIRFHWLIYVFVAILLYGGLKLLISKEDKDSKMDTENHPVVKWASKILPIAKQDHEGKFFSREDGKFVFTGLFLVLLVVEFTDLIFAVDSVPAILGITRDPYLVFFSNIFAIMGLRSLYFLLSHGLAGIHTLKYGLSSILIFVGMKMIFESWFKAIGFNYLHNLMVLGAIIAITVIFAVLFPQKAEKTARKPKKQRAE